MNQFPVPVIDMFQASLLDFPSLPPGIMEMTKFDRLKFKYEYAKKSSSQVRANILSQALDIKREIDKAWECCTKQFGDDCAARIDKAIETEWDSSRGPPKPFELPEKPEMFENGGAAIHYWRLMVDLAEKLAAFDEQTEKSLNAFRDALKRYGVKATPPRDVNANTKTGAGSTSAGGPSGGEAGKWPAGTHVGRRTGGAGASGGTASGDPRKAPKGAEGPGERQ
ncbi:MAG: hypothetical protein M1839_009270 [Geoglossum umbratile]|nr:MAG: hypothetical protein M1839_009270 [Geoglossum umbratile]